ncbi:MAG: hypothetical protein LIO96_00985 [Lachnospiraceae bacterium]|nr:hypothetical protein [Lachnospiraceae bacterium]MCC8155115.1 hypothetical protein [Tannerellaceae bacterium]
MRSRLRNHGIYIRSAKIIEISAIKVRNNVVVDEYSTLVNPACHIPEEASKVNHITDDMVKDAPSMDAVIDDFMSFIGGDVIIGYNNAAFDMNLIYDYLTEYREVSFRNNYIDILHVARRCLTMLNDHKLGTISKYYSLNTTGEHRALKDCYLTKDCYDRLCTEYGDNAFRKGTTRKGSYTIHYTAETLALQELQNVLESIIEDGNVSLTEFTFLKGWMENHRDLQGNYPFDRVFNALDNVLEDGKVTSDELEELQILFTEFVDPVSCRSCHEEITSLYEQHVCVTGDFDYGNRSDVCKLIEEVGGIIDKSVKKATNYVVVGSKGSDNWKTGNYGSKIQKAMELSDKGLDIKIIEEKDFIPCLLIIRQNGESQKKEIPEDIVCQEANPTNHPCEGIVSEEIYEEGILNRISLEKGEWKQAVRDMLNELVKEYELPVGSLYLADNYGKMEKNKLISHSVCIWEPSYPQMPNEKPEMTKLVMTIAYSTVQSRPDDLDITIKDTQEGDLHAFLPHDAIMINRTKSDCKNGVIRIRMKDTSPYIVDYIRKHTIYCINGYVSKESKFGCCSSFEKCSDARKCVHKNKLYSKACMYRANLDQGRIFYGKNRNVD